MMRVGDAGHNEGMTRVGDPSHNEGVTRPATQRFPIPEAASVSICVHPWLKMDRKS
jgi:hypothetical protein